MRSLTLTLLLFESKPEVYGEANIMMRSIKITLINHLR